MNKFLIGTLAGVLGTLAFQSETGKKVVRFVREKGSELLGMAQEQIDKAVSGEAEPAPAHAEGAEA